MRRTVVIFSSDGTPDCYCGPNKYVINDHHVCCFGENTTLNDLKHKLKQKNVPIIPLAISDKPYYLANLEDY